MSLCVHVCHTFGHWGLWLLPPALAIGVWICWGCVKISESRKAMFFLHLSQTTPFPAKASNTVQCDGGSNYRHIYSPSTSGIHSFLEWPVQNRQTEFNNISVVSLLAASDGEIMRTLLRVKVFMCLWDCRYVLFVADFIIQCCMFWQTVSGALGWWGAG